MRETNMTKFHVIKMLMEFYCEVVR